MYLDRKCVRSIGVRTYFNASELSAVEEAAKVAGLQRAEFLRDAALVIAKYIALQGEKNNLKVSDLSSHLSLIAAEQFSAVMQ